MNTQAYVWNWGDGSSPYTLGISGATAGSQTGAIHGYLNNFMPYTVSVSSTSLYLSNKVLLPSNFNFYFDSTTNPTLCYFNITSPYLSTAYLSYSLWNVIGSYLSYLFEVKTSSGSYAGDTFDNYTGITSGFLTGVFSLTDGSDITSFVGDVQIYTNSLPLSSLLTSWYSGGGTSKALPIALTQPYPISSNPMTYLF